MGNQDKIYIDLLYFEIFIRRDAAAVAQSLEWILSSMGQPRGTHCNQVQMYAENVPAYFEP